MNITHSFVTILLHLSSYNYIYFNLWIFKQRHVSLRSPTSTKEGIDEDSPEQNAVRGTDHVFLESDSFPNKSLFSVPSSKTTKGQREN